ncbi:MAG: cupin domain-containing protein [Cyclobacteriaceae bacterium]|nr:cupin domain-containing protein [Cyclobacteriaceae bacterium]
MKTENKKEQLMVLTDLITVITDSRDSNGKYAIFEERVPPLGGPPPHTHPDEEIFYVVEGEFEFILNEITNSFKALPGSVVHVPSNALHTFKNVGNTQGLMVVLLSPGNLLNYFREIGTVINESEEIPDLNEVPLMEKLDIGTAFKYAPKYDIKFVLPEFIHE